MTSRKWIAFFSQTGSELLEIIKALHKTPDLIVVNKDWEKDERINRELQALVETNGIYVVELPNRPGEESYKSLEKAFPEFFDNCVITLHGYLRILPGYFCEKYNILNGHPGLITKYPELKGSNPQEKAFNLGLETSGSVIHRVIAEVDSGDILASQEVNIKNLTLDQVYEVLHINSISLWISFLANILNSK